MSFKLCKGNVFHDSGSTTVQHVEEIEKILCHKKEFLYISLLFKFKRSEQLLNSLVTNRTGRGGIDFLIVEVVFAFHEVQPLLHPLGVKCVISIVFTCSVLM